MLILIDTSIRAHRDAIAQAVKDHEDVLKAFISGGNIAVRCSDELTSQDLTLALCCARILIRNEIPDLQIQELSLPGENLQYGQSRRQRFIPATLRESPPSSTHSAQPDKDEDLLFYNGYGGFTQDGKEYVIRVTYPDPGLPPLPWINVIANESFGAIISERGAGFTWSLNSREHRLTPWYNDPITDPHGEALYLRDEQAAVFWSPTPGPVPQNTSYTVRHGFGYTKYQHTSHRLEQEVCVFVPRHDPVKVTHLTLHNLSDTPRRFSVFSYQRLVLGVQAEDNAGFISTRYDVTSSALMASHRVQEEYSERVCFATIICPKQDGSVSYTTDREGFIGRNRNPALPLALCDSTCLDGHTGSGLDPCLALQLPVELAPDEILSCTLLLGEADTEDNVRTLIQRYQQTAATDQALIETQSFWDQTLSRLQIQTPSPAIDVMVNGWLAYQNLCCRIWGRSAFYQSGGAFGFRDQLQDAAAMIYLLPDLTRQQILRHAEHQFVEGDVLHWWHPPTSAGIRTRFSDDLLWLPLFSAYYVRITGDHSILDQQVGFMHSRPLQQGEDETFLAPEHSGEHADLYEHCCRALDRSLTKGSHGLPLMGTGDWNDGMNRVGREGRGESVWLGFFIYYILEGFIPLCKARHDQQRVQRYEAYRAHLEKTLNDTGWDGEWYRRAYFDDGTPLGAADNEECRIDALAQAWAVISKAAPKRRIEQAMDALEKYLVSEEKGIIRLLSPPFDQAAWDPGYIKGYLPGVRENGGQYTHAALWAIQALAEAGRTTRAATMLEKISPVSHARTLEEVAVYQVEPYVIAADVYAVAPHVGRGGWTWYTGSAGWMHRVTVESLLGFQLADGDTLHLKPRIPGGWKGFKISYLLVDNKTSYDISVSNKVSSHTGKVTTVKLDGEPLEVKDAMARIPLVKDGESHSVHVQLG
jgi:cyclic beta-1,2-glucan synthetase